MSSMEATLPMHVGVAEFLTSLFSFQYVTEHEFPLSPVTGKSPWVSLNGEELHDSQLIVESLLRKGLVKDCR